MKTLDCAVSPLGRLTLQSRPEGAPAAAAGLVAAFGRGSGHGLLHLGAVELEAELAPALAYWRAFGRGFVGAACAALHPLQPAAAVVPAADVGRLGALAAAAPPMLGGELVSVELLLGLWAELGRALVERAAEHEGGAQGFFQAAHPLWCAAGRVCLHLAENKRDPERPFAFIATYARARDDRAELQHLPLSRALQEFSGAKNNEQLLHLLLPLRRAAERSPLIRGLVESGEIYHPLGWTAAEAHALLCEAERLEGAGLTLRLPQGWSRGQRPRAAVTVTVGTGAPSQLGAFLQSTGETRPNLQYHVQPLSLPAFGSPLDSFNAFTASICNLRPTSRGSVHITSTGVI